MVQQTVNPIVFNCNDLVMERTYSILGNDKAKLGMYVPLLTDEKTLMRKLRLKILPFSITEYQKTHSPVDLNGALGTPINQYLCDACIYPGKNCRVRKLSARATDFLLQLGAPTKDLRMEYRKHMCEMAKIGEKEEVIPGITSSFYEELIEFPLNGHFEYLYVIASPEMCYVIHRRSHRQGDNEYFNIPVAELVRDRGMKGAEMSYDAEYEAGEAIFDAEGLLANLWLSEELRTCEPIAEPLASRTETDRNCIYHGKKPLKHSVAYRYIHITDDTWKKYSPALTSTREYTNFNVPCWLVRAHYARMHGKTVLVKAHFAYRRKGVVSGEGVTDYIV